MGAEYPLANSPVLHITSAQVAERLPRTNFNVLHLQPLAPKLNNNQLPDFTVCTFTDLGGSLMILLSSTFF